MKYLIFLLSLFCVGCDFCPKDKSLDLSLIGLEGQTFCHSYKKFVVTICYTTNRCDVLEISTSLMGYNHNLSFNEIKAYLEHSDKECP
jgi:hypothetical protein